MELEARLKQKSRKEREEEENRREGKERGGKREEAGIRNKPISSSMLLTNDSLGITSGHICNHITSYLR